MLQRSAGLTRGAVTVSRLLACLLGLWFSPQGFATSVIPPAFPELVNESDFIVRAKVESVVPEERTLPDGRQVVFSNVQLVVTETIAGKPPTPLVLRVLGGRIGDLDISISGTPKFAVGDESIFFVQGNGRQIYPLVRMMHGLYRVQKESGNGREYIERSDGVPLRNISDVARPVRELALSAAERKALAAQAMGPRDFMTQIRAAATKSSLRAN
ncbi:MAG: hypothetical protein ABIZ04_05485 [Opitutus sp.]